MSLVYEEHGDSGELLEAALGYAYVGLPVFPLTPRDKRPHGRLARRGLHQATTDLSVVRGWWKAEPSANVGVRTGAGPVVLDVDGQEGADALAGLERQHGALPRTPCTVTRLGRSALHLPR